MNARLVVGALLVMSAMSGCSDKVDNAVEAAKSLSAMTEQAKQMGAAAKEAAEAAKQQAREQIAEGTDEESAKQQVDMAGSIAALKAMGAGSGPVVNWRELAKFVPESIGGFTQHGELDGSTNSMGGMQVTKVERKYKLDESSAEITITDANMVAMLKMPFAMSAMINEDSTRGFKKGKRIADQPAIVEWVERTKHSKATLLVGERYIVNVEIRKAASMDAAEQLVTQLDLAGLAKLKPAAE